jgi:hypothetical protein
MYIGYMFVLYGNLSSLLVLQVLRTITLPVAIPLAIETLNAQLNPD